MQDHPLSSKGRIRLKAMNRNEVVREKLFTELWYVLGGYCKRSCGKQRHESKRSLHFNRPPMLNYDHLKSGVFPVCLGVLSVFELEQLEYNSSKSHSFYTLLFSL